jgi:outer membrane protein TolC
MRSSQITHQTRKTVIATAILLPTIIASFSMSGCRSPDSYRDEADAVASDIIDRTWESAMGRTEEGFTIEPAKDTLRRRLLLDQDLPISVPASAGSYDDQLIEQWPDEEYFTDRDDQEPNTRIPEQIPVAPVITLLQALQISANNSRLYQTQKENVYQSALALDLERNEFRSTWTGVIDNSISSSIGANSDVSGILSQDSLGVSRRFKNGSEFLGLLAIDLAKLLSGSQEGSSGITFDTSFSIPLLRGSSEFIVTEPLTQAQRNVVYAIYNFERFKRTFSVDIASDYLSVLEQLDRVDNSTENYERVIASTRRARRLADAGRLEEIQLDQSVQDELRARDSWIQAQQSYEQALDRFKITLGLPTDARIELDPTEFETLLSSERYQRYLTYDQSGRDVEVPPADAPVTLVPPSLDDAGPLELPEDEAVLIALKNRLDLRIAVSRIVDAQRGVVVAADNLRADVTLLGSASIGESRSLASAGLDNGQLRTDRGFYSLLLGIDLPFERTLERNQYRNELIAYERTVRDLQEAEDTVKLDVRSVLRTLRRSRESIRIQAEAVRVAEKRVDSTNLFLQAGRTEIRDLLEAQDALNSAQDALTSAVVDYRIGELELQRDLGVLEVSSSGLWVEFDPESYDPNSDPVSTAPITYDSETDSNPDSEPESNIDSNTDSASITNIPLTASNAQISINRGTK